MGKTPGTLVFIRAQFENTFAAFAAVGDRGASPEDVGAQAAQALADFMQSPGALDEHLADQILLPAGLLAGDGSGRRPRPSPASPPPRITPTSGSRPRLLEEFLPVRVELQETGRGGGRAARREPCRAPITPADRGAGIDAAE